jgi:hypothetical protein
VVTGVIEGANEGDKDGLVVGLLVVGNTDGLVVCAAQGKMLLDANFE